MGLSLGFCPGFSVFGQQLEWVRQMGGINTGISPLGLFSLNDNIALLVCKADGAFAIGRKEIQVKDSSEWLGFEIDYQGNIRPADSIPNQCRQTLATLQGNQWLLQSRARNGNYFLAYGPSTPLRLPQNLTWNLAYLDVRGHRLWEFHLPENLQISHLELLNNGHCLIVGTEQTKRGDKNLFYSLWNEYGQELMFRTLGSQSNDEARAATHDAEGNWFLGGFFSADSTFLGNASDLSGKDQDGFIAGFGPDGKQKFWSRQRGMGFSSVEFLQVNPLGKVLFISRLEGKDWKMAPFGLIKKGKKDIVIGLLDPKIKPENDSPLQIFPNPAREVVYFGLKENWGKGKISATLHQKDGTILQKLQMSNSKGSSFRFNVSNTLPGAYFITLESGKKKISGRVVVE